MPTQLTTEFLVLPIFSEMRMLWIMFLSGYVVTSGMVKIPFMFGNAMHETSSETLTTDELG